MHHDGRHCRIDGYLQAYALRSVCQQGDVAGRLHPQGTAGDERVYPYHSWAVGPCARSAVKLYLRSIEKFHTTHKSFFEDIKKYPKAYELLKNDKNRDSAEVVNFFKEGVKQGIFRDDINFAIVNLLVHEQLDLLINSNICEKYSFLDVYESIMFTYLRGISTEKGAQELENFIREYRASVRK